MPIPEFARAISPTLSGAPAEEASQWDITGITEALGGTAEERIDIAFGAGTRLRLGHEQVTELELFPAAGVVRLTAPDMHIALFDQAEPPTIAATGIVFTRTEPAHRSLAIASEGTVTLVATPSSVEAAKMTADDGDTAKRPSGRSVAEEGLTDDSVAPEGMLPQALPPDQRSGQPRVTFAGRLGRDPRCRTTPRQIRVCTFPVAEKREATETPTWLTVVAFKALAEKVEATLKKGMFVDGVGYQHERGHKDRDGVTRTETEIYAVVVTPR